jgi:hypothetical protein
MVLNTSLNGSRQPIVETPVDAIWSILELGLDFLVIEGQLVEPTNRPQSLLDLVPVMAVPAYTLEMALSGDHMSLAPDSRSTFTFPVSTPWGTRQHAVPVDVVGLLAAVDGKSTGHAILDQLSASGRQLVDESELCKALVALRRLGVIDMRGS